MCALCVVALDPVSLIRSIKPDMPSWQTGYPNVLHNPEDPHGAFRLWYGCFTSGTDFATSQGSVSFDVPLLPSSRGKTLTQIAGVYCAQDRTNGWLYANSSDGIRWEKPALGVYDLATGAEGKKPGYAAFGTKNNIVLGTFYLTIHIRYVSYAFL